MESNQFCADYVIIGGGTAANVIAKLLTDDRKTSVIVLEAGNNDSQNEVIRNSIYAGIEFGLEENFNPAFLWQQAAIRNGSLVDATSENSVEVHCNLVVNPLTEEGGGVEVDPGIYTTGRLLGGGSSINGQQWVRGSSGYWKRIQELLGDDWSLHKIVERYTDIEYYNGKTDCQRYRGYDGFVDVRQAPVNPTEVNKDFVEAIERATDIPEILDYNCPRTPIGPFTRWQLTQKPDGSRESSDTAFLFPNTIDENGKGLNGRKLIYLFNTTGLRVTFEDNIATGVIALRGKPLEFINVTARREVIISAGVYSAEILQRSGVGPAPLLKCLGIPVIADNRQVGQNLRNHTIVPITFDIDPKLEGTPEDDPLALYTGGAFLPPLLKDDDPKRRGYQLIGGVPSPGKFLVLLISLQPHSSGEVKIQNSNPLTVSLVDNNYLGDERDVQQYIKAIRTYITDIVIKLRKINSSFVLTGPTTDVIANDAKLEAYIRGSVSHTHHWTGSNSMSKCPETGALDPTGHVYGTEKLIVADVSALPLQPDGNTQGPAYVVGWTIAELLKEKYQ